MDGYRLPETAEFFGKQYTLRTDFRVILKLIAYLEHATVPMALRWQVALRTFYAEPIPQEAEVAALEFLAAFLSGGTAPKPGPKRLDWFIDAPAIVAGVNRVAGMEVRSLPHLHWWTFLSFFHSIGDGQLSLLVGIRDKLQKGKKLDPQELEFYRQNAAWVRMERPDPEKDRLQKLLQS